jgi:hypothetical protein
MEEDCGMDIQHVGLSLSKKGKKFCKECLEDEEEELEKQAAQNKYVEVLDLGTPKPGVPVASSLTNNDDDDYVIDIETETEDE